MCRPSLTRHIPARRQTRGRLGRYPNGCACVCRRARSGSERKPRWTSVCVWPRGSRYARTAERASRVSRGFVSRQKGVSLFEPGRQGGPGKRDARAHHDRVPALEATLRPNACLRFERPGYPPTRAACEPADLPRHNLFDSFKSPSNEKSTTTLNRERFRVSCDDAMHEKKKQKSTRRRQTDADASRGTRD